MAKDLFDQLKQEHKIVQELMEQIMEASESSASDRKDMFQELRTNLIPHMEGEEKAFYPKLLQHSDSEMIALEAIEEHKAARALLTQLKDEPKGEKRWLAKFKVFQESLEHHIEEEEDEVFKQAKKVLSESQLSDIATAYEREKAAVMQQAGI
ncbi:MAG: hemerythrin domain-containing protein [Anaerolineae bacterium]|jgi:hemerythrin-like domain-containing protein